MDSHALTNHSTRWALTGLTSEIERDPVCSGRYGRSCHKLYQFTIYKNDRRINLGN